MRPLRFTAQRPASHADDSTGCWQREHYWLSLAGGHVMPGRARRRTAGTEPRQVGSAERRPRSRDARRGSAPRPWPKTVVGAVCPPSRTCTVPCSCSEVSPRLRRPRRHSSAPFCPRRQHREGRRKSMLIYLRAPCPRCAQARRWLAESTNDTPGAAGTAAAAGHDDANCQLSDRGRVVGPCHRTSVPRSVDKRWMRCECSVRSLPAWSHEEFSLSLICPGPYL